MNSNHEYTPEAKAFLALRPLLERFLDFERWGFQPVFSGKVLIPGYATCHALVYQSEYCKVRFLVSPDISGTPDTSSAYGRLHAPVDRNSMLWDGEECYCWHHGLPAAQFLEGISPNDAHEIVPPCIKRLSDQYQLDKWPWEEYLARYQAAIWEQYGQRFFDLYDVRQTTLWNRYVAYCQEYYGEISRFWKPC